MGAVLTAPRLRFLRVKFEASQTRGRTVSLALLQRVLRAVGFNGDEGALVTATGEATMLDFYQALALVERRLANIFKHADKDGDGLLTVREAKETYRALRVDVEEGPLAPSPIPSPRSSIFSIEGDDDDDRSSFASLPVVVRRRSSVRPPQHAESDEPDNGVRVSLEQWMWPLFPKVWAVDAPKPIPPPEPRILRRDLRAARLAMFCAEDPTSSFRSRTLRFPERDPAAHELPGPATYHTPRDFERVPKEPMSAFSGPETGRLPVKIEDKTSLDTSEFREVVEHILASSRAQSEVPSPSKGSSNFASATPRLPDSQFPTDADFRRRQQPFLAPGGYTPRDTAIVPAPPTPAVASFKSRTPRFRPTIDTPASVGPGSYSTSAAPQSRRSSNASSAFASKVRRFGKGERQKVVMTDYLKLLEDSRTLVDDRRTALSPKNQKAKREFAHAYVELEDPEDFRRRLVAWTAKMEKLQVESYEQQRLALYSGAQSRGARADLE